ncbi:hypothetical protein B1B04_15275 [Lysinibacillus sp. KCTC 33748]|uniref:hypothetical protein n=1 Tax=unclassified Lysinibacillus TaxID=2636778 RepID=UPI0009A5EAE0|nr:MULTISPECIES: hypothetical protein [unclassified Lysinibacillus]OXS72657.1 hypothetical protein B1B04_15275 [Lysinibacillus sp. KCTC 33748]SKB92262.1 hypothetical protein SAMN06295926_11290 [Lysinibacillus sp. AC-3]
MDYFNSKAFEEHRKNTYSILEQIPSAKSPVGWTFKGHFSIGGFEYFGFDESSDLLLVVSSNGRGIIDLARAEKISRDYTGDFVLDETLLICEGFDVLKDKSIKLASKYGGSILPVSNKFEDCLQRIHVKI